MGTKTKITIGTLLLLIISATTVYVQMGDVKMRVDADESKFYVPHEEYSWMWTISGIEQNRLFEGTKLINRDKSSITVDVFYQNTETLEWKQITSQEELKNLSPSYVKIIRSTTYSNSAKIIDTYIYDGKSDDVEDFPVYHKIDILNAKGLFFRYTVDRLTLLEGQEKTKFTTETEFKFGKKMNLKINSGYNWAWLGYPYGIDSISAQYKIKSDNEQLVFKFFDPIWLPSGREVKELGINTTVEKFMPQIVFHITGIDCNPEIESCLQYLNGTYYKEIELNDTYFYLRNTTECNPIGAVEIDSISYYYDNMFCKLVGENNVPVCNGYKDSTGKFGGLCKEDNSQFCFYPVSDEIYDGGDLEARPKLKELPVNVCEVSQ